MSCIFCGDERRHLVERIGDAVDPHPHEAGLLDRLEHVAVRAAPAAHHRREDHHPRLLRQRANRLLDLGRRLLRDRRAALRTGHVAHPGHQQPQVVVDLGDRGDRAARIRIAQPLVDGDRRLQALDAVDVGPLHLVEELPRVDRQALDVLPLPLGQQRVERQRALPRPADAGDHHQPIPRNVDVDVLQIVRPRPADGDRSISIKPRPMVAVAPVGVNGRCPNLSGYHTRRVGRVSTRPTRQFHASNRCDLVRLDPPYESPLEFAADSSLACSAAPCSLLSSMFEALQDGLLRASRPSAARASSPNRTCATGSSSSRSRCSKPTSASRSSATSWSRVTEQAVGEKVLKSLNPSQQVVGIVYQELVDLMGPVDHSLHLKGTDDVTVLMMCGLQGSGKTTTCGKLGRMLKAARPQAAARRRRLAAPRGHRPVARPRRAARRPGLLRPHATRSRRRLPGRRRAKPRSTAPTS